MCMGTLINNYYMTEFIKIDDIRSISIHKEVNVNHNVQLTGQFVRLHGDTIGKFDYDDGHLIPNIENQYFFRDNELFCAGFIKIETKYNTFEFYIPADVNFKSINPNINANLNNGKFLNVKLLIDNLDRL